MSENLSDSSDYSDSSQESVQERCTTTNINDLISWNSAERKLTQFKETFQQYSTTNRLFVIKSRCLSSNCSCNFRNFDIFLAKVFVNLKLLVGKWCKLKFSKSTIPETDKLGTYVFFKEFQGLYEVMNENLEVIPFWNTVNQIVSNSPKSFIIRKDGKCLVVKEGTDDPSVPHQFEYSILKAGTILNYCSCKKYVMKKGRKVKDQLLAKCKDSKGNFYYLSPDDVITVSPIAGQENISGAHSFESIIEKFRFPLNLKSIFSTPPLPNLPCTERHFLQLSERHRLDLIFVSPMSESKRLFIITPAMFDDHVFKIGDFLSSSVSKYSIPTHINYQIETHQTKINEFFLKCHKFDSLSYLLKHSENISKIPQKFESGNPEFDETYLEVEDIYFFIRNGFYPRNSIRFAKPKKSDPKPDEKSDRCAKFEPVVPEIPPSPSISKSDSDSLESESSESSDSSTSISSTESDLTSSTALEMSKQQKKKQTKSVPLIDYRIKNQSKSSEIDSSPRCHIDIDLLNLSSSAEHSACMDAIDEEPPVERDCSKKDRVDVTELYQHRRLLEPQKFKISDVDNFSLKNTAV